MYSSKEIRWFIKENLKNIEGWFSSKDLFFSAIKSRTDFYLHIPDKNDIGFKLREGNIELKLRQNRSEVSSLLNSITGYYENWIRWGFKVAENDIISKSIIQDKKYSWIEVQKDRLGVKLTHDSDKNISIVSIDKRIPYGCQIEYTRLLISDRVWFTFGIEWFGDEILEIPPQLLDELFGNTILEMKDSMGYNEFLNMITQDTNIN